MPKVVLITGVSSGIGKATALLLTQRGYIVYGATRVPETFPLTPDNFHPIKLDLTKPNDIDDVIQHIRFLHGKIDILINNAGYAFVSSVEDMTEEAMFAQFNINVFGVLRLCKAVTPLMRSHKNGVIINISSFLGKVGLPLFTLYNASKYAVEGITDSLRYELKPFNIRVHSVLPGFFNTDFANKNLEMSPSFNCKNNPYFPLYETLVPNIITQINHGNDTLDAATTILDMIENDHAPARVTTGDKAKKFIPMRRELSDEDFERRVTEYYQLNG